MQRGFSLLEAIVALTIVGLALVGALGAYGVELRTGARVARGLEAAALAESRLASLQLLSRSELSPLTDSLRQGRFPQPFEHYQWEARSRELPESDDLFQIGVVVSWSEGSYSLASRLYRPRPLSSQ
jgi:prepilin-type N-terminal cleavage/methylation domain-containing protein